MFLKTLMPLFMTLSIAAAANEPTSALENNTMQTFAADRLNVSAQADTETVAVNRKVSSINAKASTMVVNAS